MTDPLDPTKPISNQLTPPPQPKIPEVQQAQTVTREVNAPTDTVQGQISSLLAKDNPLMTSARTKALDYMNSRGLQNSSMAAQAGEQAVIETALPIAQQDASTYFNQGLTNQGEQNTTNRFNVSEANRPILQQQAYEQNRSLQHEGYIQNKDLQSQAEKHQLTIQEIDNQFKSGMLDKEQAHQLKMQKIDNDFRSGVLDREQAFALKQQQIDQDFRSGILDREQAHGLRMAEFEADVRERLQTLDNQSRLDLEKLAQDNARILNVSRDAMDAYRQSLVNISNIQSNPDTTPDQKRAQVESEKLMLQNALSLAEGITGTDLSGSIDWSKFNQTVATPQAPAPQQPSTPTQRDEYQYRVGPGWLESQGGY